MHHIQDKKININQKFCRVKDIFPALITVNKFSNIFRNEHSSNNLKKDTQYA